MDIPPPLRSFKRQAWLPLTSESDGDLVASKFSGRPWLSQTENWPECPNCGKPMQLFVQLNLEELPVALDQQFGRGLLQFFYCTNNDPLCEVDMAAWEPFSQSTLVRIIEPLSPKETVVVPSELEDYFPARLITGWQVSEDYPSWDESQELGVKLGPVEEVREWERLTDEAGVPLAGDKLAGWPYWVQNIEYPHCPVCNEKMRLVFQVDSNGHLPFMFGDVGCGHITQCKTHLEQVAFGWACC